jgi:hypothetical protein
MRNVLIASYDMEVGGVERSLAGMLDAFDYEQQSVDLMLYRHSGDFMELLSDRARLLDELPQYASFRQGIGVCCPSCMRRSSASLQVRPSRAIFNSN